MRQVLLHGALIAGLLAGSGPVASGGILRVAGTVRAEGGPVTAEVRAWAVGSWLLDHPEDRFRPVAETTVRAGGAFSLEVPAEALPVSVEASAAGHVGRSFLVVVPEQAELPLAWLPPGRTVKLRVRGGGGAVAGALVWGRCEEGPWGRLPGRWVPSVTRTLTDQSGVVEATVPARDAAVELHVLGPEGRWATWEGRAPLPAAVNLVPGGRELTVRVVTPTGEPAAGALVASAAGPPGTVVRTGEDGRAVLRVARRGGWVVVASSDGRMARLEGSGAPAEELELRLEMPPVVHLVFRGAPGPVVVSAGWIPPSLPGAVQGVREGELFLPRPAEEEGLRIWGPDLTPGLLPVAPGQEEVVVPLRGAASIGGRVIGPAGEGVEGVRLGARVAEWWRIMLPRRSPGSGGLVELGEPLAITGPDGSFRIGSLPAEPLELVARAEGYPPARSGTLEPEPGGAVEVTLKLVQGAAVSLRVLDPAGEPVPGVTVEAHVPSVRDAGSLLFAGGVESAPPGEPLASGVTGEDGRVVLEAVPVGTVDLALSAEDWVVRTIPDLEVPPEGVDLGDQELHRAVSVQGRVVDPEGRPVPGAEVMATRNAEILHFKGDLTAGEDGRFVVEGLDPRGEIYLRARAAGWIPGPPVKVTLPPEGEVEVPVREGRTLTGRVVDAESGEGLEGLDVELFARRKVAVAGMGSAMSVMPAGKTTSGQGGTFRVEDLEPGTVVLNVSGGGYQPAELQVSVPEDRDPEPVTVRLKPGETLRGRVLGPDGGPVAGATVEATGAESRQMAQTAADGTFVLEGLAPGELRLVATASGGLRGEAAARAGSGEEVVLRLERPGRIVGRVLDPEGSPVAGASVMQFGPDDFSRGPLKTGADGGFSVEEAEPGTWRLSARAEGFAGSPAREVEVKAGEDSVVELRLERGGVVEGVVRGLEGSELDRCRVLGGGAETRVQPDGSFRLEGVRPGRVTVRAMVVPGGRARSVVVDLPDPAEPAWVEIDFGGGATLTGTVTRAGLGVPGLAVSVIAVGGTEGASTTTGEDGAWRVEGLEPGEYQVQVRTPGAEVLTGQHLVLEGDLRLDLEVPAGGLEGRVLDRETGLPLAGAAVEARRVGIPEMVRRASSGEDGRYRLGELPDGEYAVTMEARGYRSERVPAAVREGLFTPLDVELEPGGGVTLVVRTGGGAPAASIWALPLGGGVVGTLRQTACDGGGRCTLEDLPGGDWILLVGEGSEAALVRVRNPGPEVPVTLRPVGRLRVTAPRGEGPAWRIRAIDGATGLPLPVHRYLNPAGGEWVPVPAGGAELRVPAGAWTVEAVSPDGASETRTVEVPAGGTAEVVLGS